MADAAAHAPTAAVQVLEVAPPRTKILTFACEIPADMSFVPADPDSIRKPLPPMANSVASPSQHQQEKGIVGTIAFLGEKSVMIWFGWGTLLQSPHTDDEDTKTDEMARRVESAPSKQQVHESIESKSRSVGVATNLVMGPLVVGMPRNKYRGAFSDEGASSLSKLIGSSDDVGGGIQDTRIASLVVDRLSQRLDLAIFCSCNLEGPSTPVIPGCDGVMEQQLLRSRAGALAEREIGRMLAKEIATVAAKGV